MDSTQINTNICPVYPEEAIKHISVPCFFIGCVNDDKVPEDAVLTVYNNAKGLKRLWITNGRRHYDSIFYQTPKYFYKVNRFIKKCVNNNLNTKKSQKITRDIEKN